ncbi:MAG: GTPase HflX [Lachnospiraceae bacterium]|nr:GTPase HflX [Lachnospiraceae bacterium]
MKKNTNFNDFEEKNASLEPSNRERAVVVGLCTGQDHQFEHSMEELISLCEACDMEVVAMLTQTLPAPHQALYIGTGKVQEVIDTCVTLDADTVVFDNALSPSQVRNLSTEIQLPILDRTALILEIFSNRAQTREAKLQVELARLQYLLPRLAGMGTALSRQGGGSGSRSNKGAGEKKLELDRRHIEHRITECKRELELVKKNRITQRKSRKNSVIPQVSLVGYTNAGKSTIMNQLLSFYGNTDIAHNEHKMVLQKDMLFATLETTIRKITPPGKSPFYLSDTVGFIDKLPHNLIDAFRSTLEEVCEADLLLQVVDVSDPYYKEHMRVTNETLAELGAGHIPQIIIYNKADRMPEIHSLPKIGRHQIHMSAKNGIGIPELMELIMQEIYSKLLHAKILLPYTEGSLYSLMQKEANIICEEYRENGIYLELEVNPLYEHRLRAYVIKQI